MGLSRTLSVIYDVVGGHVLTSALGRTHSGVVGRNGVTRCLGRARVFPPVTVCLVDANRRDNSLSAVLLAMTHGCRRRLNRVASAVSI